MKIEKRKYLYNVPNLLQKRRRLRNDATASERMLWSKLNNSQIGVKFRRQFSIQGFILDFYCPAKKLAVELDGEVHAKNQKYDKYRDEYLKSFGIKTLRFKNQELELNPEAVIKIIVANLFPPPA